MSARLHSPGLYRAYKKINGKEYQVYFKTQKEADKEQKKLEDKSHLYNSLLGKKVFRKCGRLWGYSIRLEHRPKRKTAIHWQRQLRRREGYVTKQRTYRGNFARFWQEIKKDWIDFNELTPADLAGYKSRLKEARMMYMQDIVKLEIIFNRLER